MVADFPVGRAELWPSTISDLKRSWIGILERQPTGYDFVGYSDCVGEGGRTAGSRERRARAVAALFPKPAAREARSTVPP